MRKANIIKEFRKAMSERYARLDEYNGARRRDVSLLTACPAYTEACWGRYLEACDKVNGLRRAYRMM